MECGNFYQRYRFRLTPEDREKLNAEPWCHICGTHDNLHVDHDHSTHKIRHYLCNNCNTAIGLLKEDPELMENAMIYLSTTV